MNKKYKKLRLRQLDSQFKKIQNLKEIQIPAKGWIWEIRNALGMSHSQLAKRLKVSAPAIANSERSEAESTIKISTLKKTAEAMKCKLVYAIVPSTSLEQTINEQTLKVAGNVFNRVSHSMKLEEQGVSKRENKAQLKELLEEVKNELTGKIWDYEV